MGLSIPSFQKVIARITRLGFILSLFLSLNIAAQQPCNIIYVSPGGSGSSTGTPTSPTTLQNALTLVSGSRNYIRMLQGSYTFSTEVTLVSNVTIDGGYVVDTIGVWEKQSTAVTSLTMNGTLVSNGTSFNIGFLSQGANDWTLQDLSITVPNATGTYDSMGRSVYGIYIYEGVGYNIKRCTINAGSGSAGDNAANLGGTGGGPSGGGFGSGNVNTGQYCGGCGGSGGVGSPGSQVWATEIGGTVGAGCCSSGCNFAGCSSYGCDAGNGGNGTKGADGPAISGAASNASGFGLLYTPVTGSQGNSGDGGAGGGGGGSGAYGTCCDDPTNCGSEDLSGGNGGAGGQGGLGGNGGYGGGGSFGIYVYQGTATVTECTIATGGGGAGGLGGAGNTGATGLGGGPGSANGAARGGSGGNGGNGGDGGNGGKGQTGATGPNDAIYNNGSVLATGTTPDPTLVTVNYGNTSACSNSEVTITKGAGNWVLPSGASYVSDSAPGAYSYSNSSQVAVVTFNNPGAYTLGVDGDTLTGFINITTARALPVINSISTINSSHTLCAGNSINLGTTTSGNQYEWLVYSATSGPSNPLYTYTTQNPGNTPVFNTAGLYYVRFRDSTSCCGWSVPVFVSFTVDIPPSVNLVTNQYICTGTQDTITANASGGSNTYAWSTSQTTSSIKVNPTSTTAYSVTVTDGSDCATADTITVNVSTGITITSITNTPVSCNGGPNNGTATVNVTGGIIPYSYQWSPGGATLPTAINLAPGPYTVTVNDRGGCSATGSTTITEPPVLAITNVSHTNVICYGGNTGSIIVTASGGTGPYQYSSNGSNFQVSDTLTGLVAGSYPNVTVKDQNNCTVTSSVNIGQPSSGVSVISVNTTDVSCSGGNNGSISIDASGGSGTLQYSINGGTSFLPQSTFNDLPAGIYSLVVEDSLGCTANYSNNQDTVTQPAPLVIDIDSFTNPSCNGVDNGAIYLSATGGVGNYEYSIDGGQFKPGGNFTGLPAGSDSMLVEDGNGCQQTADITLHYAAGVTITLDTSYNISCHGLQDGYLIVSASRGTTPYSYLISTSSIYQSSDTFANLAANTYSVEVKDAAGCTAVSGSVTITDPAALAITVDSIQNIGCSTPTGSIFITATGGTGSYTYQWSDGTTNQNLTGEIAGNYIVTVTDANGCSTSSFASITQQQPITITLLEQPAVSCFGLSNGTIEINVYGGTGPYTYIWSNNDTLQDATDLAAGPYTVTVTDFNGCQQTATYTVGSPTALGITDSITNVPCPGGTTGSIVVQVTGGTTPYSYRWNTGFTDSALTNIGAGNYTVVATDDHNCTIAGNYSVSVTGSIALMLDSIQAVNCFGNQSGAVYVTVSGGTGFTYNWSNSTSGPNLLGVGAGNYGLTVSNSSGCSLIGSYVVPGPATALSISSQVTNELCYTGSTGAIAVTVTGGTPQYTYAWTVPGATSTISNLTSGPYTVTVTDSNGCTSTQTNSISQPTAIKVQANIVNASCQGTQGSIFLTVNGGTPGYTYIWSNNDSTGAITDAAPGPYAVTVTDANGCADTASYTVTGPAGALVVSANVTNEPCKGNTSGSIVLIVTGGSYPYTYNWSVAGTDSIQSGLAAGSYIVTVTDAHGCYDIQTYAVTEPALPLTVNAQVTNEPCNGNSVGSIALTVTGGTAQYSYTWSVPGTTATISSLPSGPYTVTVTDANSCSLTENYTITEPSAINVQANIINATCQGNQGSVFLTVSGGTPGYTYHWSNNNATDALTNVPPGNYPVTITDNNSCTDTTSFTITGPASGLSVSATVTNEPCKGNTSGSIVLVVTGGTYPYTYNWSVAGTDSIQSGLAAGSYTVTVTDAHGCFDIQTNTVTEPALPLTVNAQVSDEACHGNTSGSIALTVTGGTTQYTYIWTVPGSTSTISNLSSGPYSVTVTDANACSVTQNYTVTEPSAINVQANIINATCQGNQGSVFLTVNGGTPGYTYHWSNNNATDALTNVPPGNYPVTITDNNSCTDTASYTITGPASGLSVSATVTNEPCKGNTSGSIVLTVTGGSYPYTYQWSVPGTDSIQSGLAAGSYIVTVSDAHGCFDIQTFNITEPALPLTVNAQVTDELCHGNNTGAIALTVTGGTTQYTYAWTVPGTSSTISNLVAGPYTVTVTDANACSVTENYTITEPSAINIQANITNVTCAGSLGSIFLTVNGGTPGYTYHWIDGSSTAALTGINAGTYAVTVTDNNSCTDTASYTVTGPASPLTVTSQVTNEPCNGDTSGAIVLIVSGGSYPYTYQWSVAGSDSILSGLSAGPYNVTVSDSKGCSFNQTFNIAAPSALGVTSQVTNEPCKGNSSGAISLTVTGGTTAYSYNWSVAGSGPVLNDLAAGPYGVTVSDKNGCSLTESYTVTQPSAINIQASQVNVACSGSSGSIFLTVDGGTPNYSYIWSNDSATADLNGLQPGTYTVTVTDLNNCVDSASYNIIGSAPLVLVLNVSNASCNSGNNGAVNSKVLGGAPPITYQWSNGQTTDNITGLIPGSYTLVVTDSNGCSKQATANVLGSTPFTLSVTTTNIGCQPGVRGSAIVTVTNGKSPFYYLWSNDSTLNSPIDTGLNVGTYLVAVTDSNGCIENQSFSISQIADLSVIIGGQTTIYIDPGQSVALTPTLNRTGSFTYLWTPAAGLDNPNLLNVTAMPTQPTEYTLVVTDSSTGCSGTDSVDIVVSNEYYVPNIFSPNGSNPVDRTFTVLLRNDTKLIEFRIFNRYGQLVFDRTDIPWDGTANGVEEAQATFVYEGVIQRANGQQVAIKGDVTLIR